MSDVVLVTVGVVLVFVVFIDALATTIAVSEGGGPLTARLTAAAWRGLIRAHRPDGSSAVLAVAGPCLLVGTVLLWVVLLWAGWSLVFLSGEATIVNSSTRAPAGVADTIYYAGFTVFTLGVGDFVATTAASRLLTAAASFTGLFLITLAITYLISVVSAVVDRRALAVQIGSMGSSPGQIVAGGWSVDGFSQPFMQQLIAVASQVATTAEQHLAYPVLHYFHSRSRDTAAPVAVAQLDEAMLILDSAVAPGAKPPGAAIDAVTIVVGRYLRTVGGGGIAKVTEAPPLPDLSAVRDAGVPLAARQEILAAVDQKGDRRKQLAQLVASDGWSW